MSTITIGATFNLLITLWTARYDAKLLQVSIFFSFPRFSGTNYSTKARVFPVQISPTFPRIVPVVPPYRKSGLAFLFLLGCNTPHHSLIFHSLQHTPTTSKCWQACRAPSRLVGYCCSSPVRHPSVPRLVHLLLSPAALLALSAHLQHHLLHRSSTRFRLLPPHYV